MAMGLATCAPQGLSPLELRSSLEFSPPESWVLDAHPGRLQGEESGPRPPLLQLAVACQAWICGAEVSC